MAVLRIALGPIVLIHLHPFLADAAGGVIYRDRFTLPFWAWFPELPRAGYLVLLWMLVVTSLLLSIGLWTRVASWITALGVTYNILLSQTHFHHNRAFLVILLLGAAALPLGRTVSVDAWLARRQGEPTPVRGGSRLARTVLRLEIATVYVASGFSKMIDPDWWGGTVLRLRIESHRPRLAEVGIPAGVVDLLADPGFQSVVSKVVVATELFIGLGLLVRATRKAALWTAIPFHIAIQFTAAVQVFSFAALAALVLWVDKPGRWRTARLTPAWARVVRWLDWTGRFKVEPGTTIGVTEGDRIRTGRQARWFILSRLPLTFWFAAPVLLTVDGPEPSVLADR